MSVVKKTLADSPAKIALEIDNGDLQAVTEVMEKYNFKDEEALLRFVLYVLIKAQKNTVYVDEGDKKIALTPAQHLIKQ